MHRDEIPDASLLSILSLHAAAELNHSYEAFGEVQPLE